MDLQRRAGSCVNEQGLCGSHQSPPRLFLHEQLTKTNPDISPQSHLYCTIPAPLRIGCACIFVSIGFFLCKLRYLDNGLVRYILAKMVVVTIMTAYIYLGTFSARRSRTSWENPHLAGVFGSCRDLAVFSL